MTVHTATDWKTDEQYGWFIRTRNDKHGKGGGREIRLPKGEEPTIPPIPPSPPVPPSPASY